MTNTSERMEERIRIILRQYVLWKFMPEENREKIVREIRELIEKTCMEVCICAAVQMPDGYVVRGHRHSDCIHTIYGIKRYQTGLSKMYEEIIYGFMTTKNRFVDRKEGLKLQLAAGIKSADKEGSYRGDELYSEDLY